MRIMVFDVPAVSGGALSILNDFYNDYKTKLENEYIFVVSKPEIKETKNIKVLRFEWVKKSWFHRLYFDYFVAPKLIKKFAVDEVLSLQNIIIPYTKVSQAVYYHNALPLADYRFSILDEPLLWVYQNILSKGIFKSLKKAQNVIVQTKWMKKKCIERLNIDEKKITQIPPKIEIEIKEYYSEDRENISTFFYPSSGVSFKNHRIIVDACNELNNKGINDYNVLFTLNGNENKNISKLHEEVKAKKLPIKFVGSLPKEVVYEHYSKYILLFTSYIETVGLPLIEAKIHKTPIVVSDCDFSHEVLEGYDNVRYFDPFDKFELTDKLEEIIVEKRM